jgi:hypothetical protein
LDPITGDYFAETTRSAAAGIALSSGALSSPARWPALLSDRDSGSVVSPASVFHRAWTHRSTTKSAVPEGTTFGGEWFAEVASGGSASGVVVSAGCSKSIQEGTYPAPFRASISVTSSEGSPTIQAAAWP